MPQRLNRSIAAVCSIKTVWCAKFNNLKAKISIFIQWVWWQQVSGFGWWCVTNFWQQNWWVAVRMTGNMGTMMKMMACRQQSLHFWWAIWRWWSLWATTVWQSSGNSLTRGGCATPCHPPAHPFSLDVALFSTTICIKLFNQSDIEQIHTSGVRHHTVSSSPFHTEFSTTLHFTNKILSTV